MRRLASIFMLLTWLALGTGLLAHLHALQHRAEAGHAEAPLLHDEAKCQLCAQCHPTPTAAGALVQAVTGEAPADLLLPARDIVHAPGDRAPNICRGPPVA